MNGNRASAMAVAVIAVLALLATLSAAVLGWRTLDSPIAAFIATKPPSEDASTASPEAGRRPVAVPGGSMSSGYTATDVDALLELVRVVPRQPNLPGYDRDCGPGDGCVFGTEWTDDTNAPDSHDGCDTRNNVLAEQLVNVVFKPDSNDCDVVAGFLTDPYTGVAMDYATEGFQIHIDHLFALAAAWDLGAAEWTPAKRARFANDTELELLAVNGAANLSKSDSTPASWLPKVKAYRCEYVSRYLTVAAAYDLAITAADVRVITLVQQRSCPY